MKDKSQVTQLLQLYRHALVAELKKLQHVHFTKVNDALVVRLALRFVFVLDIFAVYHARVDTTERG